VTKRRSILFAATLTATAVGCVICCAWSGKPDADTQPNDLALTAGTGEESPDLAKTNSLPTTTPARVSVTNEFFDGSQFCLAMPGLLPKGEFAKARTEIVDFIQAPNGSTFGGDVSGGAPSGWGVFNQPNGTRLEGEWRHGIPYRINGKVFLPDGTVEQGTWDYVRGTGHGTITWKDGRTYSGDWRIASGDSAEVPEGVGTMTWTDGHKFVGHFYDGQMHGWGTMTQTDGKKVDGLWQRGEFMLSRIDH
jgi:hypothetical protein